MTRLRDTRTGVVVSVDDATAARLGTAYKPADEPAAKAPETPRRKTRGKKNDE